VETSDGTMKEKGVNFIFVDSTYINTMQMKIVEGRNYNSDIQTESQESVLVNEAAVEVLGWGDNPIGKKFGFGVNLDGTANVNLKVVGVVKNFHYASLHNRIDPLIIMLSDQARRSICIRIQPENQIETLRYIETVWNEFCPTYPFDYSFLDASLIEQYRSEERISKLFTYFAILCIFIACLGLFGLAAHTAERRTREISIRKVMGASVSRIVYILTREFSIWVLWSNVIGWAVAYYALKKWLQNFAYTIDQSIFTYILAGIVALLIALFTVSFSAIRAAQTNPADALKYE